ncbi:hypothetical protein [Psychroserpens jangbogonensis]|uniref:hypothetical protein n=1 Tax=Psychroserpens jangbogonensis TaxID=1484460 RepID=UPI00053E9C52|nr:hypothetical protein [Psychroserpens jangbogonensis]
MIRSTILILITAFLFIQKANAQYPTTKIKDKHQAYTDSLKQVTYDNIFPVWGQKAYQKGFDIPYPTGVMVNYVYVKQGLIIDNMRLGLQTDNLDLPLTSVNFIEFGDNYTTANTVMIRPDIWILPFLNVYGLFGKGNSKTEVNLKFPIELKSIVEQEVRTTGIGLTAAGGLGPVWLALDANITWNKPELLDDPVEVKTFGIRFGHNFVNKSKPYRNFGFWVGAMSISLGSNTVGELKLNEALPPETWERADQIVAAYDNWYDNTATIPQKVIADQTLGPLVQAIGEADGEAVIRYGLDKSTKQKWNGIIGAQYQHNKNWMFRTEAGVIGDRKMFLLSLNYRFLL